MIQELSSYIRNIAVFIIFVSLIDLIIPSNKYKGYIHLASGFILILIMIEPIGFLFSNTIDPFQMSVQTNRDIIMREQEYYESRQRDIVLNTHRTQLESHLQRLVSNNNHYEFQSGTIVVSNSIEYFGTVKRIYLALSQQELPQIQRPFIRIERVDITAQNNEPEISQELNNLKNVISNFYNLSEENIYITVQRRGDG